MLQGTSLARLVTVADLIGAAKRINAMRYIPLDADITVGRLDLGLTMTMVALFR